MDPATPSTDRARRHRTAAWPTPALLVAVLLILLAGPAFAWWDFSPYTEHQDLMSRSIDIVAERYPDMAAEVTAYRDQLLSGTHDEDFDSDETNGSYSDYSGFSVAVPGAWWPTATRPVNAIQWVHDYQNPNYWDAAVAAYGPNRSDAYYKLGHILHNLQDLFVPAHAHISPHGSGTSGLVENHSWPLYFDNFEQYSEVTDNELNLAQPARIPEAELDTLMVTAATFSSTDNDTAAFYPSQYFAQPDAPGGWGRYKPYPSGGYPCGNDRIDNDLANAWSLYIVPRCCEVAAGAIRAFYVACNPTATEEPQALPAPVPKLRLSSPVRPGSPIRIAGLNVPATITLLDISGRTVARLLASPSHPALCPTLPPGIYACRITTGSRTFTQPIIIVSPAH
jgi:hypothetical protein